MLNNDSWSTTAVKDGYLLADGQWMVNDGAIAVNKNSWEDLIDDQWFATAKNSQ